MRIDYFPLSLIAACITVHETHQSEIVKIYCIYTQKVVNYICQTTIKFSKFTEAVISENSETVATLADEIIILLGDRNKKCKLLK